MYERNRALRPDAGRDSIAGVINGWHTARPDLDVEPIAITARLARLRPALGTRLEQVFAQHDLTGADFAVLATIVRTGGAPLSQRQLMAELNLTAGTISVRVNRLVRDGLVSRDPDPTDGRGALIGLTDRGRAAFEACAPEHLANARQLVSGLTKAERDQLAALLSKLLHSLEPPAAGER
ncbi:MarR family transcriptional regulator [Kribbella sp.]|uniref:MarR family winged helix-turn-helix transcriptional regulator n=1 Tax=Kribbella sp. TaxID=1871183 RepID=UPI002D565C45|nr:MarR family transcriptional regulator [Kribbella sp.]HZX05012.1 MarR family transcriptional regulator [Kribbella sp.]